LAVQVDGAGHAGAPCERLEGGEIAVAGNVQLGGNAARVQLLQRQDRVLLPLDGRTRPRIASRGGSAGGPLAARGATGTSTP
jgi:hypothetical protein